MDTTYNNRTKKEYVSIYATIAGIYILVIQLLYERVIPQWSDNFFINLLVDVALNGLAYFVITAIVLSLRRWFWKRKNKNCWIEGKWYHMHIKPCDPDDPQCIGDPNYIRIGEVTITQDFYDVSVNGNNATPYMDIAGNIHSDDNRGAHWHYILSQVGNNVLTACYEAKNKIRTKEGMHILFVKELDGKGFPKKLSGIFSDISPSNSEGTLAFFKDQADRDNEVQKFFSNTVIMNGTNALEEIQ